MPGTISTPFLDDGAKARPQFTLRDTLKLESLTHARLVAGEAGLDRPVLWSHVVDMPDPAPWVPAGYFLLTTGYSWPREARAQRRMIEALAAGGIAGVGLAVARYVESFSKAEREAADRAFLPLVEIPFEVPFARITEELHRAIMAEPYRAMERAEQIHRALMRGASRDATLDDLARILCPLIGRSVTFEDPHGKLFAHCSIDERADAVRRETLERAQTPPELLRALAAIGLEKRLRASDVPVRVPAMPEIGMTARLACPIRLGTELVGVVWIIEGDEPLSDLDHRAAEYAALVAAIRIAHQRELASLEASLGHASVLSLLESEPDQTPAAEERVRLLGFDAGRSYRAAIALLPEEMPLGRDGYLRRDRLATRLRDALHAAGCAQLVAVVLDRVPFLLPEEVDVATILGALGVDAPAIVVGRAHPGVEGARRSYREALSLIRYRKRAALCRFEDVLVPRVLAGDAEARQTFLADLLAPLRAQRGGAGLVTALIELARSGFRMRETAERLGIHPNTLRYRLGRASDILGTTFEDAEIRFRLQLAARLLDIDDRQSL